MPRRRRVAGAGLGTPDVQPLSVAAKLTHLTSRNESNQARAVIPAALQCQLHWVVAISQKWDPRSLPGGSEVIDQPPQLWRSSWRRWRAPSDLEEPGLPPLITEGPLVIWPTLLQPLGHPLNGREGTGGEAPDQRLATEPLTLM
jgi:hypothetical protein